MNDNVAKNGRWLAFQGFRILVSTRPGTDLIPAGAGWADLGLAPVRQQRLGVIDGRPCHCGELAADAPAPDGMEFRGLRTLFGMLDDADFALAGRALQIVEWDRSHQYCGACGGATHQHDSELAKICPACERQTYPRISPAIMVLLRRGDELLLARSPHFAPGVYSALAGFVEAGETLEQTVAREVREEVGLEATDIRYFGSQPWPFPHSLMIAFVARADGEPTPDGREIEDAAWFPVDRLPQLPSPISISRRLIEATAEVIRKESNR